MKRSTHPALWLVGALLLSPAIGNAAEDAGDGLQEKLKSAAAELISRLPSRDIKAGPFTVTMGPQENGGVGAILSGSGSTDIPWLNSATPSAGKFASGDSMLLRYGTLEFAADANWSSKQGALNQTSISLKPSVSFAFFGGARWSEGFGKVVENEKCELIAAQFEHKTTGAALASGQAERIAALGLDKLDEAALLGQFVSLDQGKCQTLKGARPPRQHLVFGLYPDVRYRVGRFEQDDTVYDANQLIYGGGARLFFPSATTLPFFREAPRISAGYYTVHEAGDSDIPLPEDIKQDFLQLDARLLLRVPFFGYSVGTSPIHLDVSSSATKATRGGGDWKMLWKGQLSFDSGGQFSPAITYQSGKEQGLEYDKQLILGFMWNLVNPAAQK